MRILACLVCILIYSNLFSQNNYADSLNKVYPSSNDTSKVKILLKLSAVSETNNSDLAFKLADSGLTIAKRISFLKGIGWCYSRMGSCLTTSGKYDNAIDYLHRSIKIFESIKDRKDLINALNTLAKPQCYSCYNTSEFNLLNNKF